VNDDGRSAKRRKTTHKGVGAPAPPTLARQLRRPLVIQRADERRAQAQAEEEEEEEEEVQVQVQEQEQEQEDAAAGEEEDAAAGEEEAAKTAGSPLRPFAHPMGKSMSLALYKAKTNEGLQVATFPSRPTGMTGKMQRWSSMAPSTTRTLPMSTIPQWPPAYSLCRQ
jgi:hypothetical protein